MFSGMLALASYVIMIPTSVVTKVNDVDTVINNVISNTSSNAQGLFLSMIAGIVSIIIFDKLMNMDQLRIKMPDAVPPAVSSSFSSLIPTSVLR